LRNSFVFLAVLLALFFTACPKRQELNRPESAAQCLAQALKYKEAKKYPQAEDAFTYCIFNFPGSNEAADAQFHLADCYFESKNYSQAQSEFDFYLKNFPNGRYDEEAKFKLALASLRSAPDPNRDQTFTIQARELFAEFLEEYPESRFRAQAEEALREIGQRLAHKEFEAARLYFKTGEHKSALIYYEFIKDNYPDINWSAAERYRLAVCYINTGQAEKARPLLKEIIATDASPKLVQAARRQLQRLN